MTLDEFLKSDLERVQERDLQEGDIFSYGDGFINPHVFVRVVTKVSYDAYYNRVINGSRWIQHKGFRTTKNVSRVSRHKEYDPTQQPYDDNDI